MQVGINAYVPVSINRLTVHEQLIVSIVEHALLGSVDLCGLKFVQTRGYLIAARGL
ncbi:hypothetical protein PALI_a0931 [Pseudoalteromonas aliena SW19]|jgi:hypothetical protein|uniref:Uncharacterized protein n=1 Tax=Pseudoalteromonas aliena SW19 TaxID=1314866 RepID=A0ABR9DZ49_9GAMM|nr:hypothetical protein [Pseudoalteromonas aliena SW19]